MPTLQESSSRVESSAMRFGFAVKVMGRADLPSHDARRWQNSPHLPAGIDQYEALAMCLQTWPTGVRPKIHFSSPRTEQRLIERKHRTTGAREERLAPPIWSGHADYLNPFECITFLRGAAGLPTFDVMLECKLKDVALLRLREDLRRYAPDLAHRLEPSASSEQPPEDVPR